MSVAIVCKAKDPKSCRYHTANSIRTLTQHYKSAKNINDSLVETYTYLARNSNPLSEQYIPEIIKSMEHLEKTELDYYSTPEGELELQEAIDQEEDLSKKLLLESKFYRAQQRKKAVEKGEQVEEFITPSHSPMFTLPAFRRTAISPDVDLWEGNKYNPHYTIGRIREFVKGDIKKAKKIGVLPPDVEVTVRSDHKTNTLYVQATSKVTEDKLPLLQKQLGKLVKAYGSATVIRYQGGGSTTDSSFNVLMDVKRAS
jgi:hypothetical protein